MFGKQSCWIKNSSERSVEWTCGKDYQFHVRSVWYCLFSRSVWQIKKALSYLGFFYKDTERNKTNKKLECIRGLKETTLLSSCRWAGETNYANIAFFSCTQMALWTGRGHDPLRLQLPPSPLTALHWKHRGVTFCLWPLCATTYGAFKLHKNVGISAVYTRLQQRDRKWTWQHGCNSCFLNIRNSYSPK